MPPRKAYSEIKNYIPTITELTSPKAVRPFFDAPGKSARCPFCNASKRSFCRLETTCIEGTKTADSARRALIKRLPQGDGLFQVIPVKSNRRKAFFDWLDTLRLTFDLAGDDWLMAAARAFLQRREPKTDWDEVLAGMQAVKRSTRIEEGWELATGRLYLAPTLYDEVLVVQYLLSRSHEHRGRTFEGRLTLLDLIKRMRYRGYLQAHNITERDQFDVLEKLIDELGGTGPVKLYYIVDRRDFLEKAKGVYARYKAK